MSMTVGDTGPDVVEMKNQLRAAGYFDGPDDDYFGEDLAEAVRKYQAAHGLTVDGVVGPETWGNIHGDPAYPNNSAGTMGGGGGGGGGGSGTYSPAAKGTPESVSKKYPYLSFLLDDPDPAVRELILRADRDNMSAADVQSELMQTSWWKRTSEAQRAYFGLKSGDPATLANRANETKAQLQELAVELGYDDTVLDAGYLEYFAHKALQFGMSTRQMKQMLADEITPLIGTTEKSNVLRDMRQIQQNYMYAIDQPTQQYWLKEIGAGRQSIENFENTVRQQMKGLFPNLSGQFDSGMTFKQIIEPYRQVLSKEFDGRSMEDFDFMGDAKWRHVIDYVDEKTGVHRTMSMQELQKYARQQPEWRNTKNAKDQVSQIGEQLLQSFGAVK